MSDDNAKAERIKAKISASQARNEGRAPARKSARASRRGASNRDGFFDRALDDHPLALLAGSVVLGAVAAAILPRSFGSKLAGRALGLAAVAGELSAFYGNRALGAAAQGARAGQDKLEDLGEVLADHGTDARRKAIELGTLAGKRAIELAGVAAREARDAGSGARRMLGELSERARH